MDTFISDTVMWLTVIHDGLVNGKIDPKTMTIWIDELTTAITRERYLEDPAERREALRLISLLQNMCWDESLLKNALVLAKALQQGAATELPPRN